MKQVLLEKKRYEGCDYDSFAVHEDEIKNIIDSGEVPEIVLPDNEPDKLTVGLLLGRDGSDYSIDEFYVAAIKKAGLNIRLISYEKTAEQMQGIRGMVLPGGFFNSPQEWYVKKVEHETNNRTRAYIDAVEETLKTGMPILGICAGMQMLAGVRGYKDGLRMYYNLKEETGVAETHKGEKKNPKAHVIKIANRNSKFFGIVQDDNFFVNSNHGESIIPQSISPNGDIKLTAVSGEGIVEAIELVDHPFAIGVQWHPEYTSVAFNDKYSERIFEALARAAAKYTS
ncbi:MAG: gamma-glutamyl-gamma-aminobutyrate hydrolase family protein [Lactobacillus sp.]|jgi:putative glutamine amidotransferase|nr:gamma-glutamyl-gamma-aminobutyrate hydrolase family protein [Lactobacillus sp.]